MRIKHLLIGMLAMSAAVACQEVLPVLEPTLEVSTETVSVAATAGEATFNVTTNQSWVTTADADWVSMDPSSGDASEKAVTVKVTAEDNETTEARTATVTVKAGKLTKTVTVNQAAGEADEPGPEDPELQKSEWALVGTFGEDNNWNPASELYLSVLDEEYFVYYGLELATDSEFKFLKGGAWPPAGQEVGGNGLVEPNTIQPAGGSNIKVTEAGKYDIYLAADLTKFYIMSEGKLPAEAVEPAPVDNQWGMMGCFVDNQWATDVPMTKEGEWIVAKGAQFTELTFKIRANASWADGTNIGRAPGSERAYVNAKIEVVTAEYSKANLGGDAADIKLDGEPGTYDVYFNFENLEVYVMEQGAKPGEKEPIIPETPAEITYTVVGTLDGINWSNNAPEGLMIKEGDYYVGKNISLVTAATLYGGANQIEFKVVETGTWTGYAHANKENENFINAEIPVISGGENIIVKGAEGAYDVYFDKANLKVWVMEAGFKPGEKEPLIPEEPEEPEQPELQKSEWALVGSFGGWDPKSDLYLSVLDENYFVYYGFDMPAGAEFKFLKGGVWPPEGTEIGGNGLVEPNTIQAAGGSNIKVNEAGKYDIYLAADLSKFYIMSEGKLPSEATEPAPVEKTWGMMGCFVDNQWSKDVPMTKEGEWIVAKGAQFTELTFKIRANESWSDATNIGLAPGSAKGEINTKVAVVTAEYSKANLGGDAADIKLNGEAGTYDVYFSYDNLELYVMTPGLKPGETPVEPEQPAFVPGEYWIVANEKYAMPLTGSYGYLQVDKAGYTDNVFTFAEVEGGYTIQQPDGKYLYMKDSYDSFNASATVPSAGGHVWTVEKNEDGTYKILNVLKSKYIQLDSQFGTYGSYNAVKGTMPNLVSAEEATARPVLNLATEAASVENDVTTYTIKVTSNLSWTATPSEGVTLDKTSGTGDAEVVMTFAANETEAAVAHTVTFSGEGLTKTFTLTHKAPATGNSLTIELSAATKPCDTFPDTSTGVTTKTTYTIGDYEWTFAPSSGNKFSWYSSDKYILWGKSGGYILMPAVEGKKLTSVTILTGKGASTNVKVGVYNEAGTAAVAGGTAIQLNKQNAEFSWTLTDTEVNTHYQLRVTSSHNAQLQKLVLVYE